ncbi:MAG: hypothetical protein IPM39_20035 [Chloroflexi bacterium]|nr:hypothetical protein [Chloroflexota bacterium]
MGAVPGWLAYLPDQCAAGVAFFDRGRPGLPRPVYRGEHFRRPKGNMLSITPVYVQRDDHAQGLFHLLSLAARLLALGDYTARRTLADQQSELSGIYPGNPKRATARPTMERLLEALTTST